MALDKFQTFQGVLIFKNDSRATWVFWNSRPFQGQPWSQGQWGKPEKKTKNHKCKSYTTT